MKYLTLLFLLTLCGCEDKMQYHALPQYTHPTQTQTAPVKVKANGK